MNIGLTRPVRWKTLYSIGKSKSTRSATYRRRRIASNYRGWSRILPVLRWKQIKGKDVVEQVVVEQE